MRVSKHVRVLSLKEVLLLNPVVSKLLHLVTRLASYDWLLTRILREFIRTVPKTHKVQLD